MESQITTLEIVALEITAEAGGKGMMGENFKQGTEEQKPRNPEAIKGLAHLRNWKKALEG